MNTKLFLRLILLVCLTSVGQLAHAQFPGSLPGGFQSPPLYGPAAAIPMPSMGVSPASYYGPPVGHVASSPVPPPALPVSVTSGGKNFVSDAKNGSSKGGKGARCGCDRCCLSGGYDGHMAFFGDFLYLRVRDAEVAYAVPFDGPIQAGQNTIQVGPIGVADMDFQPAFRAGFDYVVNECSKFSTAYTMFESGTMDQVVTQAPLVVRSIVGHPGTATAGQTFLQADAQYDISFDLVDVDYHQMLSYCEDYQLAYVVGLRFAQHEQEFEADFAGNSTMSVDTDIDFYGAGLRFGLEYERYVGCQWSLYARGYGNLVPGEFRADYDQRQSFDARVIDTGWKAGRLVTMWELETGFGWTSKCGYYSFDAGYVFSAWTNMVQTDEWIRGVHNNSYIDMDSTTTFDGGVARFTMRY